MRPFPFADVERVIREDLGQPIERLFLEFDAEPLAAASIGQVHRAVLPNGRIVAVKVQRPNAPRQIESDIDLLEQAARLVRERVRALDFIDTREIVDEFARSIRQELDYRQEGRNAEAFHRNFAGHPHVAVPRTYWSYTRERVLTLEYLSGVQLADLELADWTIEQRKRLAYIIAETWLTMIFRHGLFHGDPHPANILVISPERIGLVDFGLVGKLTDRDLSQADPPLHRRRQRERRGAPQAARRPRRPLPARATRSASSPSCTRSTRATTASSLKDIDPLQLIREGFALIYEMNLRLPTRFVLLDKAIATVGAVGIDLYPEFNVFEVARPLRALADDRALHPAADRRPGAARELRDRPDGLGAPLPGARHPGAAAGGRDRVRLRPQGARRVHAQARRDGESPRDRARHDGRTDRVEPDRHLCEDRARTFSG